MKRVLISSFCMSLLTNINTFFGLKETAFGFVSHNRAVELSSEEWFANITSMTTFDVTQMTSVSSTHDRVAEISRGELVVVNTTTGAEFQARSVANSPHSNSEIRENMALAANRSTGTELEARKVASSLHRNRKIHENTVLAVNKAADTGLLTRNVANSLQPNPEIHENTRLAGSKATDFLARNIVGSEQNQHSNGKTHDGKIHDDASVGAYLSSEEIARCLEHHSSITLHTHPVVIHFSTNTSKLFRYGMRKCTVYIEVSRELHFHVHYVRQTCTRLNSVEIRDAREDSKTKDVWNGCEPSSPGHDLAYSPIFVTDSHSVRIEIFVWTGSDHELVMNITAVPNVHLQQQNPSANLVLVQTRGWSIQTGEAIREPVDDWVSVHVPDGDVAMVSFQHTQHMAENYLGDGCYGNVELYREAKTARNLLWTGCYLAAGDSFPMIIYSASLHVHYVTHEDRRAAKRGLGFRLLVSFHNAFHLPRQLSDGKWNCTTSYWDDVKMHFLCDAKPKCVDGEDNIVCPYTGCLPGQLHLAGKCFVLGHAEFPLTWTGAMKRCYTLGGRLAVMNDLQTWSEIEDSVTGWRASIFPLLNEYDSIAEDVDFPIFPAFDESPRHKIFIGLKTASPILPKIYKNTLQWMDGSIAYFRPTFKMDGNSKPLCAALAVGRGERLDAMTSFLLHDCGSYTQHDYMCEMKMTSDRSETWTLASQIEVSVSNYDHLPTSYVVCPDQHLTHAFLACDVSSACYAKAADDMEDYQWGIPSSASCSAPMTSLPPSFACDSGSQRVSYSFVCDHRPDCQDGSDESFCPDEECIGYTPIRCGADSQCFSLDDWCDGTPQCLNRADEDKCQSVIFQNMNEAVELPAAIFFDIKGNLQVLPINESYSCPETHFLCAGGALCLPVYVRCNGVFDCPDHEDETGCSDYMCPGHYRCRGSSVCVHPTHVCDGVQQCPQHDDELLCHVTCPEGCTCYGLAFLCTEVFADDNYTDLRYLDASGSGMTPSHLPHNTRLVHLGLARCNLTQLDNLSFPSLLSLDLSENDITSVAEEDFRRVSRVRLLSLAGNPLTSLFTSHTPSFKLLPDLEKLDLSRVIFRDLDVSVFSLFPNLQSLNLSGNGIQHVHPVNSQLPASLRDLDIRGCPLDVFPKDFLIHLLQLRTVQADTFKLCCPAVLPENFNPADCHAPDDVISSCDALIGRKADHVIVSVLAVLAVTGNLGSLIIRACVRSREQIHVLSVFLNGLCVSNFLMGVYLAMIGVAHVVYGENYLWEESKWRHSVACKTASFVSVLSSQVSSFSLFFITLDRLLVSLAARGKTTLRLHSPTARVLCVGLWIASLVMACLPFLPFTSPWYFHSQTELCLPLPGADRSFPGGKFATGFYVFNSLLHVLVTVGQLVAYAFFRKHDVISTGTSSRPDKRDIGKRYLMIALSDSLSWLLVGAVELLETHAFSTSKQAKAFMALVLLPVNSSLNPFLYGMSVVFERRRIDQERRLLTRLVAHRKAK